MVKVKTVERATTVRDWEPSASMTRADWIAAVFVGLLFLVVVGGMSHLLRPRPLPPGQAAHQTALRHLVS